MKLYVLLTTVLFSVTAISAQEKSVTAEPVFFGAAQPTVNRLPLPEYPKDAQKAGLGGRVSVAVTVDEAGNVISAEDATGPYPVCNSVTEPKVLALRAAATEAAKKATFKPAMGEQGPSKVTGHITYIFTPVGYKPDPQNKVYSVVGVDDDISPSKESQTKEIRKDRMTVIGNADVATNAKVDSTRQSNDSDTGTADRDTGAVVVGSPLPKAVSGGVLNGKARSLPKPLYPAAAKAVRAGGAVSVLVVIFEDGSIYSAQALSGHPLLRHASEIAACSAGFTPTILQGNPVKVSGVITYNFVP